ncbi:MAG: GntR family transcriptional regulator [Chloroflexi bacterium]|nr:GntR family transcriptional regulator [Chloroflexota bacterium]
MTDKQPKPSSALSRPQHQSLADLAYNALLTAIVNQEFEPGAHLSIDAIAKQLAMSNTPVREALMRANGERLVFQKANHGFVVTPLLSVAELRQIFDLRYVLELHALSQAQLPHALVPELRRLAEQMSRVSDGAVYSDFKDYLRLDHDFHRTLISMAGNAFLLKAWEDLHIHLHLSRLYTGVGLFDRSFSASEHDTIVDALQSSHLENAKQMLAQHIRRVEDRVGSFLQNR